MITRGLVGVPLDKTRAKQLLDNSLMNFFDSVVGSDTDAMIKMAQKQGKIVAVWDEDFSFRILDATLWNEITDYWLIKFRGP